MAIMTLLTNDVPRCNSGILNRPTSVGGSAVVVDQGTLTTTQYYRHGGGEHAHEHGPSYDEENRRHLQPLSSFDLDDDNVDSDEEQQQGQQQQQQQPQQQDQEQLTSFSNPYGEPSPNKASLKSWVGTSATRTLLNRTFKAMVANTKASARQAGHSNKDHEETFLPLIKDWGHHHHDDSDDDSNFDRAREEDSNPKTTTTTTTTTLLSFMNELPKSVKLLIGIGGIYSTYLYVGSLQEDVFLYVADDGSTFNEAWFLQMMESLACMFLGFAGILMSGLTFGLPLPMFWWSGAAQVSAKAYSNLALAAGLSYPTMILAKSAKLAPVMVGSMLVGGAKYRLSEYIRVFAIKQGTVIVSLSQTDFPTTAASETAGPLVDTHGEQQQQQLQQIVFSVASTSSILALAYIVMSLVFDGVVAGFQKRLKMATAQVGIQPTVADFLFWFSVPMTLISGFITVAQGDLATTLAFCLDNPELQGKIFRYSLCSALGSVFVFYTLAHFDPLVLSTVTTTRKLFSVFLSMFLKGHTLSYTGWAGMTLACIGILSELHAKRTRPLQRKTLMTSSTPTATTRVFDAKVASFRSTIGY